MQWIVDLLSTLGIFGGAIIILVISHELGHFLTAKFFGMRVERFSLFFPPRIWGFQKGETDYCIGAVPLGGYVKISGMIDESMDTDYLEKEPEPWEFRSKPVWQRMVVISAGVIFNMILAAIIFAGIAYTNGEQRIPNQSVPGIYVPDSSLVHDVGFRTGDKLITVNGDKAKYFGDLFEPTQLTKSHLQYTFRRDGTIQTLTMPDSLLDEINSRGFISLINILPAKFGRIINGLPADSAGLKTGDEVTDVNGAPAHYWLQFVNEIEKAKGPVKLTLSRDGQTFQKTIRRNKNGKIGVTPIRSADAGFDVKHIRYSFFGAIGYGVNQTGQTLKGIIQGFEKLFSGQISVRKNLGGPVAIAKVTKQTTDQAGWLGFWRITAFLSVTLAIMNILPIPVLDGGHLMFLLYEGITRREPSEKVRMALQQVGFIIIIALFVLITFNDILRLF